MSTESSEILTVLGSENQEAVPNLLFLPLPQFRRNGLIGVWQTDVVAWYTRVADNDTARVSVIPPQDVSLISKKGESMHASTNRKREDVTFASVLLRFIPLLVFVGVTILLMTLTELQPAFAFSLLLLQIGVLVIAIRAWIPRTPRSRE